MHVHVYAYIWKERSRWRECHQLPLGVPAIFVSISSLVKHTLKRALPLARISSAAFRRASADS